MELQGTDLEKVDNSQNCVPFWTFTVKILKTGIIYRIFRIRMRNIDIVKLTDFEDLVGLVEGQIFQKGLKTLQTLEKVQTL